MRSTDAHATLVNALVSPMLQLQLFIPTNGRFIAFPESVEDANDVFVIPLLDAVFGPKWLVKADATRVLPMPPLTLRVAMLQRFVDAAVEALTLIVGRSVFRFQIRRIIVRVKILLAESDALEVAQFQADARVIPFDFPSVGVDGLKTTRKLRYQ